VARKVLYIYTYNRHHIHIYIVQVRQIQLLPIAIAQTDLLEYHFRDLFQPDLATWVTFTMSSLHYIDAMQMLTVYQVLPLLYRTKTLGSFSKLLLLDDLLKPFSQKNHLLFLFPQS
jgi:hypothetical protein